MERKGKKFLFLGDSITAGVGASNENNVYWKLLERNDGCIVKGYGISGTRIANQQMETQNTLNLYFRTRLAEMDNDADVVVVFGGTNDYGHGDAAMGSFSDRTDDTFYGALHNLYQDLINKYPTARIVILTPLHRLNENNYYNENGIRCVGTLSDYVEKIKEVAKYYSFPVLDLYSLSGFQPDIECNKNLYLPDGLHPSDLGYERIYNLLKEFLKSL